MLWLVDRVADLVISTYISVGIALRTTALMNLELFCADCSSAQHL
jgi:hypothetical protein